MLRNHFSLCVALLLGSAVLLGPALPAKAAPLYHADGAIAAIFNGHVDRLKSYSLDLGVQAGGSVNYDELGVHAQTDSLAEGYGVHSRSYSQLIIPAVDGSFEFDAASTAIATFTDVTVSGPLGGTVSTSINLDLSGGSLVGSGADPGTLGFAFTNVAVWVYVNGTVVGQGSHFDKADTRFGPSTSSNGMLSSWSTANPGIVTSNFDVQSGIPFEVKVRLTTDADTEGASTTGTGMSAEANVDFSHTFSFALNGPVFNLPTGYTANSPDAHIVANQVLVVPEPSSLVYLASVMILGLAVGLWRRMSPNVCV